MRIIPIIAAFQFVAACAVSQPAVITEINYNSPAFFNPEDWIEIYNNTEQDLDISGWIFKDEIDTQSYEFPENTVLESGGFIVLCVDTSQFKVHFVGVECYVGNFAYGLSGGGELIRLYNTEGYVVDYLIYDDQVPWPPQPNGLGPTLELIHPYYDNTLAESWQASSDNGFPFGSPGMAGWLGVESPSSPESLPSDITLSPAYPNPFNSMVNLTLYIPSREQITLKIFDIRGNVIATLLSGIKIPGTYELTLNVSDLPSGVYFARLLTGNQQQTRSLILIK